MANYKNFEIVRVCDVITHENHPDYGGTDTLGSILFTGLNEGNTDNLSACLPAKPLNFNISQYPTANELVMIVHAPRASYVTEKTEQYYYLPPIGVLSDPGSNAVAEVMTGGGTYYEGRHFQNEGSIRPLRPYEGDIMIEGRYGNSIRFGSTTWSEAEFPNLWSHEGWRGDPITIIRNGQKQQFKDEEELITEHKHITEDINYDYSSIYLCSSQRIDFVPASTWDESYQVDLYENSKITKPNRSNSVMGSDVSENKILKATSNLPPVELQKLNELSDLRKVNVAYYDVSPTENQRVNSDTNISLKNSTAQGIPKHWNEETTNKELYSNKLGETEPPGGW